jgi:hypothetical protein
MNNKTWYIYLSFSKYSKAIRKNDKNSTENLQKYCSIINDFLNRFEWTLSYSEMDISNQEKNGNKRFIGVCYDACKYLAQKLENQSIEYKSYWIGSYGKGSIKNWLAGDSLHSFNLCKINEIYYFADNFFAPMLFFDNHIFGFISEKAALSWATEALFYKATYIIREYNPLMVRMDNHIVFTIRRLLNYKD